MDFSEIKQLVAGLEDRGARYILQSAGSPSITLFLTQTDRQFPEYAYLHFTLQKVVKDTARPQTVVMGSDYSIFRDGRPGFGAVRKEESTFKYWANKNIRDGIVDMVAIGLQSRADSALPAKLEAGKAGEINWCTCCDKCVELLIHQMPVDCVLVNKDYARALAEAIKMEGKLKEKHT
jgi:2,4-dienoyl-CoA reductase-like NADH-dependent reductase (Old Yellow Enzyme family)